MKTAATMPVILLAEDDPVSAAFLREALAALPARVELAGDAATALAAAATPDLLLLDAHLPDASGIELLLRLRNAGVHAPAVAHTASREDALHRQLCAAGFLQVLVKPLAMAALQDAARQALGLVTGAQPMPAWDDAAALAALGRPEHVQAMRDLFLAELPGQRRRIEAACVCADHAALRGELHRLTASCGFVGAARLGTRVRALHQAPGDPAAQAALRAAIDELLSGA